MLKRIALVLLLVVAACAPASAIEYGAPSLVSVVASHSASLATLSADVITRANATGSTGLDFGCATLTVGNASFGTAIAYSTLSPIAVATDSVTVVQFSSKEYDLCDEYVAGTFTAKVSGIYAVDASVVVYYERVGPDYNRTAELYTIIRHP